MADNVIDDFLFHFGVKGMKWGVRRDSSGRAQLGAAPRRAHAKRVAAVKKATTKKPIAEEHQKLLKTKKARAKHLSDSEIKAAIGRMNLERQYNQLNPNTIGKGYKVAIAALAVGTTINSAVAFSKSPAGQAVIEGVKKALASRG